VSVDVMFIETKPYFSNSYTGNRTLDIPLPILVSISPFVPQPPLQVYT
jgi:hypothetical protein